MKILSTAMIVAVSSLMCVTAHAEITAKEAQSKVEVLMKDDISSELRIKLLKEIRQCDPSFATKPLKDAMRDDDRSQKALKLAAVLGTPGLTKAVSKHLEGPNASLAVTVLFNACDKDAVDELYDLWADDDTASDLREQVQTGFTTTAISWTEVGFKVPNKWARLLDKDDALSNQAFEILKFQFAPDATSAEALGDNWRDIRKQYETLGEVHRIKGTDLLRVCEPSATATKIGPNYQVKASEQVTLGDLGDLNTGSFTIQMRVYISDTSGQLRVNLHTAEFMPTEIAFTDGEWTFGLTGAAAAERTPAFTTAKSKSGQWVTLKLMVTENARTGRTYRVFADGRELAKGMWVGLTGTIDKLSIATTRGEFVVGGFELIRK